MFGTGVSICLVLFSLFVSFLFGLSMSVGGNSIPTQGNDFYSSDIPGLLENLSVA